jgi:hypothetical protein
MVLNILKNNNSNDAQSTGNSVGNIFNKETSKQKSLADQINKEAVKQASKESNLIHSIATEVKDTQDQMFDPMNPPQSVIDFIKTNSADHYDFISGIDKARLSGTKILYVTKGDSLITDRDQKFIILNISKDDIKNFSRNNSMSAFKPFENLNKIIKPETENDTKSIISKPEVASVPINNLVDLSKIQTERKRINAELENFSKYAQNNKFTEKDNAIFSELREKLKKLDAMEYLVTTFEKPLSKSDSVISTLSDPNLYVPIDDVENLTNDDFGKDKDIIYNVTQKTMPFPNDTPTIKKSGDTKDEISSTVPGGKMNQINTKTIPTLENETNIKDIQREINRFRKYISSGYNNPNFIKLSEAKKTSIRNKNDAYLSRLVNRIDQIKQEAASSVKKPESTIPSAVTSGTLGTISSGTEHVMNPPISSSLEDKQEDYYDNLQNSIYSGAASGPFGTLAMDEELESSDSNFVSSYGAPTIDMESDFGDETADTINQFGILDTENETESITTPVISYAAPAPDMESDFGSDTADMLQNIGIVNEDNEITPPFVVEQSPVTKTESVATSPEDVREMELEKRINASTSIAEIHSILKEFGGINGPMGRISYDDAWSSIRNYFYGSEEYTLPEVFELRSKVIEFKNAFDERERQRNADLDALGLESGPIRKKGTEPQEMTITPRVNIPVNTVEHDQGDLMKSFLNREYGIDLEDKKLSKLEQLKLNLDQARAKYALMQGEYNKKSYIDRIGAKFANLGQSSSEVTQEVFNAESEYQKIKLEVLQAMAVEGLDIKGVIAFIHEENEKLANALPAKKREVVWKGMKKLGLAGVSAAAFVTNTVKDSSVEMLKNLGFSEQHIDTLKPIAPWIGRALLAIAMSAGTGGSGILASLGMTAAKYAGAEAVDTLVLKKAFAADTVEKQTEKIAKNYGEKDLTNTEILKTLEKRVNKSKLYAVLYKTLRAALKIGAGIGTGYATSAGIDAITDYVNQTPVAAAGTETSNVLKSNPQDYWTPSNVETPLSKFMAEHPDLNIGTPEFEAAFAAENG